MAEQLNLSAPIVPPAITNYRVMVLELNWKAAYIGIGLEGPNGEPFRHSYTGATATTLMTALNKANLTSNSLHRCVIQRLIDDGVIAGTISGSPD